MGNDDHTMYATLHFVNWHITIGAYYGYFQSEKRTISMIARPVSTQNQIKEFMVIDSPIVFVSLCISKVNY